MVTDAHDTQSREDAIVKRLTEVVQTLFKKNQDQGVSKNESSVSDIRVPVVKSDGERGQVFGFAMFSEDPERPGSGMFHIDKQDDFIHVEDLEDAVYDFVLHSRDGGIMHVSKGDATLIESLVFTPEKLEKMGLPKDAVPAGAWWLGYQVHGDEARKMVRDGHLGAFSIEGMAIREEVEV